MLDQISANSYTTFLLTLMAVVFILKSLVKKYRQRKIPSRKELTSRLFEVEHAVFSLKHEISSLKHENEIDNENSSENEEINKETSFITPSERQAETAETDSVISA